MNDDVKNDDVKNDVIDNRKQKNAELRASGVNLFPNDFSVTHTVQEAQALVVEGCDPSELESATLFMAGRMMAINKMGKSSFIRFRDRTGQMQAYLQKDKVGDEAYDLFKKLDIGDFIGLKGGLFQTRTGEWTLLATEVRVICKSSRPLPKKFHGLKAPEKRYRQV